MAKGCMIYTLITVHGTQDHTDTHTHISASNQRQSLELSVHLILKADAT